MGREQSFRYELIHQMDIISGKKSGSGQIFLGRQQSYIDVAGVEHIGVLGQAEGFQPLADAGGHAANSSSSALASFRSFVSKPSVNQS